MFGKSCCLLLIVVIFSVALALANAQAASPTNEWKPVEDAMGRTGQVSGDVIRFGMPRKSGAHRLTTERKGKRIKIAQDMTMEMILFRRHEDN